MKGWPGEPDMDYDVLVADGEAATNAGKPITDVIFDFGNVLIYWDPAAVLIPRYSQKTIDAFLDNDISGFYDVNDLMDGGTSTEEAIAIMRERKGRQVGRHPRLLHQELPRFPDRHCARRARAGRRPQGCRHRSMGTEQLGGQLVPCGRGTV